MQGLFSRFYTQRLRILDFKERHGQTARNDPMALGRSMLLRRVRLSYSLGNVVLHSRIIHIKTMTISAQQAARDKVTQFVRVGNGIAKEADRKPAIGRIIVNDIHHHKQGPLCLRGFLSTHGVGNPWAGIEIDFCILKGFEHFLEFNKNTLHPGSIVIPSRNKLFKFHLSQSLQLNVAQCSIITDREFIPLIGTID